VSTAVCGAAARIAAMSRAYLFISRVPTLKSLTQGSRASAASVSQVYEARVHAG